MREQRWNGHDYNEWRPVGLIFTAKAESNRAGVRRGIAGFSLPVFQLCFAPHDREQNRLLLFDGLNIVPHWLHGRSSSKRMAAP